LSSRKNLKEKETQMFDDKILEKIDNIKELNEKNTNI